MAIRALIDDLEESGTDLHADEAVADTPPPPALTAQAGRPGVASSNQTRVPRSSSTPQRAAIMLHQIEPEPAFPRIGGAPADGTVALVLDVDAHETVERGGGDPQRRTGRLIGVADAVGHQLGHEQAGVGAHSASARPSSQRETCARATNGAKSPQATIASPSSAARSSIH